MKKFLKIAALGVGATALMTTRAAAEVCLLFVCVGGGGGGGSGGDAPAAPEISMTHGLAALAVLACVALLLRERFLRQRAS